MRQGHKAQDGKEIKTFKGHVKKFTSKFSTGILNSFPQVIQNDQKIVVLSLSYDKLLLTYSTEYRNPH